MHIWAEATAQNQTSIARRRLPYPMTDQMAQVVEGRHPQVRTTRETRTEPHLSCLHLVSLAMWLIAGE
jgi:hypothetical protein